MLSSGDPGPPHPPSSPYAFERGSRSTVFIFECDLRLHFSKLLKAKFTRGLKLHQEKVKNQGQTWVPAQGHTGTTVRKGHIFPAALTLSSLFFAFNTLNIKFYVKVGGVRPTHLTYSHISHN